MNHIPEAPPTESDRRIRSDLVGLGWILVSGKFLRIWSDSVGLGRNRSDLVGPGRNRSDLAGLGRTWSDLVGVALGGDLKRVLIIFNML